MTARIIKMATKNDKKNDTQPMGRLVNHLEN